MAQAARTDREFHLPSREGRVFRSIEGGKVAGDDPFYVKLDQIAQQTNETRLVVERMSGDQRTGHADMSGKLNVLNTKFENAEKQQEHIRRDQDKKMDVLSGRIANVESTVENLDNVKHFSAGKTAGLSAVISVIIGAAMALFGAWAKSLF